MRNAFGTSMAERLGIVEQPIAAPATVDGDDWRALAVLRGAS